MRKRAAVSEHTILNIIGVVLVAIVLVVIVPVVYRIIFPSPGGPERTMLVSLESLQEAVLELLASPGNLVVARNHPLFIDDTHTIVAFNPGDKEVRESCFNFGVGDVIVRPKECPEETACICLYKRGDWKSAKTCKNIAGNVVFLAPVYATDEAGSPFETGSGLRGWNLGSSTGSVSVQEVNDAQEGVLPGIMYENLVLHGLCSGYWRTQPMYIEKFVDGGTEFVYVAREGKSTNARFVQVKKKGNVVVV